MSPKKYFFNEQTGQYEPKRISFWKLLGNVMLVMILSSAFAVFFAFQFYRLVEPPEQRRLRQENRALEKHYPELMDQLENQGEVLSAIEKRDMDMHRVILESEPEAKTKTNSYPFLINELRNPKYLNSLVKEYLYKHDTILHVVSDVKELLSKTDSASIKEKYAHIPTLQPLEDRPITSGFGYRIHPIYKIRKFNYGVDYQCATGTPVYATADGEIILARSKGGHGRTIIIDHKNGYETWYTHLKKAIKQSGSVKKGEVIALVGNTGVSISPHLHYEIHYKGKAVNPISYFFGELGPKQMVTVANIRNMESSEK